MRVLVATDKFAGTLSAPQAALAIAEGWRRTAPADEVSLAPVADGGPGFLDVLSHAWGVAPDVVTVTGPLGEPVPAQVLLHDGTAYIESAQACGLHLVSTRDPMTATTRGVGELLLAALATGARRVVIGLGGSATNDGGAGLWAALGATADRPLHAGPAGLVGVTTVDLSPAHEAMAGVTVVAAADVDVPLLGMFGATKTFGPQKGLSDEQILSVDHTLDELVVAACGSAPADRRIADASGAGAAGGLGFALAALGAQHVSGIGLVADALGLDDLVAAHDLVIAGEGAFDFSSRSGKAIHGVAQRAMTAARPCLVLAGRVDVGAREMRALGVESAYAITDIVSEAEAMSEPAQHLADLAARVARTWSPT